MASLRKRTYSEGTANLHWTYYDIRKKAKKLSTKIRKNRGSTFGLHPFAVVVGGLARACAEEIIEVALIHSAERKGDC